MFEVGMMVRWGKAIYDSAIGLTGALIFTLGYWLSIEYFTPDEFTLVEFFLSALFSFAFTFTNSWTFLGKRFEFFQGEFGAWEYFLWLLAVAISTFVGISDGSTYWLMIGIPSAVVLAVSLLPAILIRDDLYSAYFER